jgi:type I restriction enzyme S subunit
MSRELSQYNSYYPIKYDYVDQLPTDWRLLPNIGIFQERIERGYPNEELLSVTIGRGVIKQTELDKKDSSTLDKSKYLLVYPNDLVYSMRFRQGASGYSNYKGIVSPACTVLKPRKGINLNPRYFYYLFRTEFYKNYVERFSYGIADGQIPLRYTDFKRMYSIFPPLKIQDAIVAYLDQKNEEIDYFIRKKKNLIELLIEEGDTVSNQVIIKGINENAKYKNSGVNWLGNIPEHWKVNKLSLLACSLQTGPFGSQLHAYDYMNGGIPVVNPSHLRHLQIIPEESCAVSPKTWERLKQHQLEADDIVIARRGEMGRCALVTENEKGWLCGTGSLRIRPNHKKVDSMFLTLFISTNQVKTYLSSMSVGSTMENLNTDILSKLPIPLPSIYEQQQIVMYIKNKKAEINMTIQKIEKEILAIKDYRESLITNLITGQKAVPF